MYAKIAIDVPLFRTFSYKVPDEFQGVLRRGSRALVPFHKGRVVGVCLGVFDSYDEQKEGFPEKELKSILEVVPDCPYRDVDVDWLEQASDYYYTSPGMVFSQAMPSAFLNPDALEVKFSKRIRPPEFQKWDGGMIRGLTEKQKAIADVILKNLSRYFPVLIHGVTGSGKTEIYIEVIRQVLNAGQSALYLVPEIGLTPQTLARLHAHFPGQLLVYHSGLSEGQRLLQWQSCRRDMPQVMVGTRSALFAPFANLGVVVIDEEHDNSYKQEDHFRYHARDMALLRASLHKIPVILGSATPSLETWHLAQTAKITLFDLPERVGKSRLPVVEIIDMGREKSQFKMPLILSPKMTDAIGHHVRSGQQVILFVGQRGHSQNAWCSACEHIQVCANCDVSLKYHSTHQALKCHYCDYVKKFDGICVSCKMNAVVPLGFGTQSVEQELKIQFPRFRIQRVDSDSFPSPQKLEEMFTRFRQGEIDVLLGTQMLAKGHDFSNVSFAGIVGVDAHLGLPDFRAGERAFQSVVQVAGRAGRADQRGHVLVQSYHPQHASMVTAVAQDYQGFAALELKLRERLCYPPFAKLVQLKFVADHESRLVAFFETWRDFLVQAIQHLSRQGIQVLGPVEMPVYKLRGKFRRHILLKVPRKLKPSSVARYLVEDFQARRPRGVLLHVDVDPVGLM